MIKVGCDTNKGIKRSKNEDAYHVIKDKNVFMVADGVGGNNSGELASRTAVEFISAHLLEEPVDFTWDEHQIKEYFFRIINMANKAIIAHGKNSKGNHGMATTLVLAYLCKENAYIYNVGDSRAYHFHNGKLTQITEDHSFVNTLVKIGSISKEESRIHPKKNIITRALGAEQDIDVDFFQVKLYNGDVLILSTDGLHGEVGDTTIEEMVEQEKDMQDLCNRLVSRANLHGGSDNITVICLQYEGEIDEH